MVDRILSARSFLAWMIIALLPAALLGQENNQPPEGFQALFNGKDLTGWYGLKTQDPRVFQALPQEEQAALTQKAIDETPKFWRVENEEIVNDGKGPFLTYDKPLRDYELWVDYKTVAKADSGVYLKETPQVQIWDTTEEGGKWNIGADKGSGGLWNNSPGSAGKDPLVLADKPFGEWNRLRIIQIGAKTWVWLNGKLVVDGALMENYWGRDLPLVNAGRIQLQTHGGEIRWKNIFAREIPSAEANEVLAKSRGEGFESIFDGESFSGWKGPTDNYEIVDGGIRCKPGKGGTIYTENEYGDFAVRFEFKLPPGGNNGLAIRYPGKGDTAYVGMCELQVLDSEHPKYAKLDERQYHGSAYGMQAAHRGYLRPTGEWNFQEVTVRGPRIVVELNGSQILDCDVSQIGEFMADTPHPGKDRERGHFGLAGHSDPVEFRNLSVKQLESNKKTGPAAKKTP